MTTDVNNLAKQAIHDKLESQIKTAQAQLDTLKARAEAARANLEIKAIAELLPKKQVIQQKLQELKNSGGHSWEQAKTDLEAQIADFEKSVKGIEGEGELRCDRARDVSRPIEESAAFVLGDGEEGCRES